MKPASAQRRLNQELLRKVLLEKVFAPLFGSLHAASKDPQYLEFQNERRIHMEQYEGLLQREKYFKNNVLRRSSQLGEFLLMMTNLYTKSRILLSIDIEAYELRKDVVTEIGICFYDPRAHFLRNGFAGPCSYRKIHLVIQENMQYRNGRYVKDNQDNFLGGLSIVTPLAEAAKAVQIIVNHFFPSDYESASDSAMFGASLVGHDVEGDIRWLQMIGVVFPDYVCNVDGVRNPYVVDTQRLWNVSFGKEYSGLLRLLSLLDIPNAYLHNGGNDSLFTLVLALAITDPVVRTMKHLDQINGLHLPNQFRDALNIKNISKSKEVLDCLTDGGDGAIYDGYSSVLLQYLEKDMELTKNLRKNIVVNNVGEVVSLIFEDW